jgi:ferredoxin
VADTLSVLYFSGTGNTERAARLIGEAAERAGRSVRLSSLEAGSPPAAAGHTVLAFPVYSFAVPPVVKRLVRRLPRGRFGGEWSVLAVCAGGAFGAAGQARRMLRRRGCTVGWSGSVAYPENWSQMSPPAEGPGLREWIAQGDSETRKAAGEILSGTPRREEPSAGAALWSWLAGVLFGSFGRRVLGKGYIADDACTSCGLCERTCPVGAIRMAGSPARPLWGWKCESCCRCINTCPERAIQTSAFRFFFHLGLSLALTTAAVVGAFRAAGAAPSGWGPLAHAAAVVAGIGVFGAAAFLLQFAAMDRLLSALQRRPRLEALFNASWTKGKGRYTAPGYAPAERGRGPAV